MYYISNMSEDLDYKEQYDKAYKRKKMLEDAIEELKLNNPSLRQGSITAYKGHLKAIGNLVEALDSLEDLFTNSVWIIQRIKDSNKSMNTKKAYLSVLCSLCRGKALSEEKKYVENYSRYVAEFEDVKRQIDLEKIKQKPVGEEVVLKDLSMDILHRGLLKHKRDFMLSRNDEKPNLEALRMYIVGLFHIHFKLRNELPTMWLSLTWMLDDWNEKEGGEKQLPHLTKESNHIWCASRNKKYIIINKNKVRDPNEEGWKVRQELIPKDLNWALNHYIQYKKVGEKFIDIQDSGYTKLVRRIWKHKGYELTPSLIRKLYATEIRQKYKGKLQEELKACEVLDHKIGVHNTDYVIYFD